jgi:hypothetical protein
MEVYIGQRHGVPLVLAPSVNGMLELASLDYPVFKIAYVSPESASSEGELATASEKLQSAHPLLFFTMPSPDGPPNRSGVVFRYQKSAQMPWRDGMHAKSVQVHRYLATCSLHDYSWGSDLLRGKPGYFLSGPGGAHLWRIARVESDFAGRQVFTLSPVRYASALPEVDFTRIDEGLLRGKLEKDWAEAQRCLSDHLYSSLITSVKNVVETLVFYAIGSAGPSGKMRLEQALRKLRTALEGKQPLALPFSYLDYHLMSKLRILHSHTHTDRIVIEGRLVEPEFALTVVADVVEVLRSAGLIRPTTTAGT